MLAMCSVMWREIFSDLNKKGKALFAPIFAVSSLCLVIGGVVEFLLIDIWVLLIFAFSSSLEVSDFFAFLEF